MVAREQLLSERLASRRTTVMTDLKAFFWLGLAVVTAILPIYFFGLGWVLWAMGWLVVGWFVGSLLGWLLKRR